jgi:hypothetical protein
LDKGSKSEVVEVTQGNCWSKLPTGLHNRPRWVHLHHGYSAPHVIAAIIRTVQKLGVVIHACNAALGKWKLEDSQLKASLQTQYVCSVAK